ncbi:MAG: hypothetical protein M1838_005223 [Thelocarpon superellum]|nr:MAG: hypothetical protein M1838_005223 [Thelocarpon superellum]
MSLDHEPTPKRAKKHKDRSSRERAKDDEPKFTGKKRKRDSSHGKETSPSKKAHLHLTSHKVTSPATTTVVAPPLDSPFHVQTSSLYLSLSPISQLHPLEGLCAEHLSPLILTYYSPFHGIILSYSNARLSERPLPQATPQPRPVLSRCVDESAASFVWLTAEFLLFQPERGEWIEGYVNLQNEGHVGLVCWNLFNASIGRMRLPSDWTWIPAGGDVSSPSRGDAEDLPDADAPEEERGEGFYRDGAGKRIRGTIRFRVADVVTSFDREKGFLSIEGTMLDNDEEKALLTNGTHPRPGRRIADRNGGLKRHQTSSDTSHSRPA